MKRLDPNLMQRKEVYQFLTMSVALRPIAFVTTIGKDNVVNAAPFSYYNVVTTKPARLSIVIGRRHHGYKDTVKNILESKKFMVHVVTEAMLKDVNQTAVTLPYGESELTTTDFTVEFDKTGETAHVMQSPIRFTCQLD